MKQQISHTQCTTQSATQPLLNVGCGMSKLPIQYPLYPLYPPSGNPIATSAHHLGFIAMSSDQSNGHEMDMAAKMLPSVRVRVEAAHHAVARELHDDLQGHLGWSMNSSLHE